MGGFGLWGMCMAVRGGDTRAAWKDERLTLFE